MNQRCVRERYIAHPPPPLPPMSHTYFIHLRRKAFIILKRGRTYIHRMISQLLSAEENRRICNTVSAGAPIYMPSFSRLEGKANIHAEDALSSLSGPDVHPLHLAYSNFERVDKAERERSLVSGSGRKRPVLLLFCPQALKKKAPRGDFEDGVLHILLPLSLQMPHKPLDHSKV